ncbi:hypothetical protein GIB67_012715 [Kingdonia uniflora]|uniref:Uncharacterized protein n=1 Tax=Kingdonia uniflora TaxID=39325 RepID=A0A7J7NG20_9MAGN|nr:hypothetical protein GIB67_012715 [Kingdonia uniflora]
MIPMKKGSIILMASVAPVSNGIMPHAYKVSKHTMVVLTKNLCIELGASGTRVNCISPYGIVTPMVMGHLTMEASRVEELVYQSTNLKGTIWKANDIVEAPMYLASDESRYVSGINLVVDGGYSTTNPSINMVLRDSVS